MCSLALRPMISSDHRPGLSARQMLCTAGVQVQGGRTPIELAPPQGGRWRLGPQPWPEAAAARAGEEPRAPGPDESPALHRHEQVLGRCFSWGQQGTQGVRSLPVCIWVMTCIVDMSLELHATGIAGPCAMA